MRNTLLKKSSAIISSDSLPTDPDDAPDAGPDIEWRVLVASPAQHGARLDKALADGLSEFSRSYLQQRLPVGREIRLEVKTTDRYGRSVAEVIAEININLAMVEDGQAFAYRQYLSGCNAQEYLDAEYRASRRRYGVWQVEGGITRPWDFRRGRR